MTGTTTWIGPEELAEMLGVPVRTVYAWRSKGYGPPAARFGKHLRFDLNRVNAWCEAQVDDRSGSAA